MSLSTIIQRRASIICRHVSTTTPKSGPQRTLPDEKMRALIALYHQADTFITPENLSQRIDVAFLSKDPKVRNDGTTVKDLQNALADQRRAPKIAEWDQETLKDRGQINENYRSSYLGWSGVKTGRELKVVEALYGVNATDLGSTLPGLEVLREAVANQTIPKPLVEEEDIQEFLEKEPMEVPER